MVRRDPVVLPFYHSGMAEVVPLKNYLPRAGRSVNVTVGSPVDLSDITCRCNCDGVDQQAVWKEITSRLHRALSDLEACSPPNISQAEL